MLYHVILRSLSRVKLLTVATRSYRTVQRNAHTNIIADLVSRKNNKNHSYICRCFCQSQTTRRGSYRSRDSKRPQRLS